MKKNTALLAIVLCLAIVLAIPTLALPASAKNLNVAGINFIDYYDAGGQVTMDLQTPLQVFPSPATSIQFRFIEAKIPNSDVSFDNLIVNLGIPIKDSSGNVIGTKYQPYAMFTTSPEYATFSKAFWSGTFMQLNAALYGINPNRGTNTAERNNIRVVDSNVLSVERHGNSVSVNLAESQPIYIPLYGLAQPVAQPSFSLPAFSLELSKYGDAFYYTGSVVMGDPASSTAPSWRGASGMTIVHEELQFNADAVLTSAGLSGTVTEAILMMNGRHLFYPYTPP